MGDAAAAVRAAWGFPPRVPRALFGCCSGCRTSYIIRHFPPSVQVARYAGTLDAIRPPTIVAFYPLACRTSSPYTCRILPTLCRIVARKKLANFRQILLTECMFADTLYAWQLCHILRIKP